MGFLQLWFLTLLSKSDSFRLLLFFLLSASTKDAAEKPSLPSLAKRHEEVARKSSGSAKQHYLQRSRYYPGAPARGLTNLGNIEGKVYDLGSGKKVVELTSGSLKNSARRAGVQRAAYIPSFEDKKPKATGVLGGFFNFFILWCSLKKINIVKTFSTNQETNYLNVNKVSKFINDRRF